MKRENVKERRNTTVQQPSHGQDNVTCLPLPCATLAGPMAPRRRLPVVQNNPDSDTNNEPPPWHWVPLGALVSLVVGAVLSRSLYVPFQQRWIERVYGHPRSVAEFRRVDAQVPQAVRTTLELELSLAAMAVATISVAIGAFVVGRFGPQTQPRHGTLAGITTMAVTVLLLWRSQQGAPLLVYAWLIPFGGVMGYLGGLAGVALKRRAARK